MPLAENFFSGWPLREVRHMHMQEEIRNEVEIMVFLMVRQLVCVDSREVDPHYTVPS